MSQDEARNNATAMYTVLRDRFGFSSQQIADAAPHLAQVHVIHGLREDILALLLSSSLDGGGMQEVLRQATCMITERIAPPLSADYERLADLICAGIDMRLHE